MKRDLNSLYIHIPFCMDKCFYCNFISYQNKENLINPYIDALCTEIDFYLKQNPDTLIKTIYIGGGTPSILEIKHFTKILCKINSNARISPDAEITVEINPGTIDKNYLKELFQLGINRLSIGVQSFDDKILKLINRKHNSKETIQAVTLAKEVGFKNISIDLIYGLPSQNIDLWNKDLEIASNLNVKHISAYGLKIEKGTVFGKNEPKNLPAEDDVVKMYETAIKYLKEKDFEHYEISNFAKKNYQSKHNNNYWQNKEYFGFGLSAHGYVNTERYSNTCNLESYIKTPLKRDSSTLINSSELLEEAIFLGLRMRKGINIKEFENDYGINIIEKHSKTIEKFTSIKLMDYSNNNLKLTDKGVLLSNNILAEFLD